MALATGNLSREEAEARLRILAERAQARRDLEKTRAEKDATGVWKQEVAAMLEKGAGRAHALTNSVNTAPATEGSDKTLQQEAEEEADKWSKTWKASTAKQDKKPLWQWIPAG